MTAALCEVPPVAVILAGTRVPALPTVIVAVISGMNGGALARITAVPDAIPRTSTTTVVNELPSGYRSTVAGTPATFGFEELS